MNQIFLLCLFLFSTNLFSQTPTPVSKAEGAENTPRFAIHLLDYLAHDYGGAFNYGQVLIRIILKKTLNV